MLLVIDLLMILDTFDFLRVLRKSTYVNIRRVARNLVKECLPLGKFKDRRSKQQFGKLNQKFYLLAALKALKDM
jgi:hypothetical protein